LTCWGARDKLLLHIPLLPGIINALAHIYGVAMPVENKWEKLGFLSALFDFSFENFITSKLIGLLYGLALAGGAISALSFAISGFANSFLMGIGTLVLSVLFFAIFVMYSRVILEILIVIFRIAENTGELVKQGKTTTPQSGVSPAPRA